MENKEKKIALVTGAGRGIGRAIAKRLAGDGIFVLINYCSSGKEAEEVLKEIRLGGGDGACVQADVSDFARTEEMIKEIIREYGHIDILVNNAGITRDGLLMRMDEDAFEAVIDTNLKGSFFMTKAVSRQMLKQRYGKIINMASVVGIMGNAGQANYAASKAGVIGMTRSFAREVASKGITVNAVAPGFIATDMTEAMTEEAYSSVKKNIPMDRIGTPEEVAEIIAFLAGPQSGYVTGQVICVDGGMCMS